MGIEQMTVAECEALQFECDDLEHDDNIANRRALFSGGSQEANLRLAAACGWIEGKRGWICPHCAERVTLGKRGGRQQERVSA
jgi:hypothetical protein